jgi:hypothetical protein
VQKVGKEPVAKKKVKQTTGLPSHELGERAIGEHVSSACGVDEDNIIEHVTLVSVYMS